MYSKTSSDLYVRLDPQPLQWMTVPHQAGLMYWKPFSALITIHFTEVMQKHKVSVEFNSNSVL